MEGDTTRICKIATFNLNQWAMDFEHNKANIIESIKQAEKEGASIRFGPELEIPGYSCEDHFLEMDTTNHSWEVLAEIIEEGYTDNIICDIGIPVYHKTFLYNCKVVVYKRQIHLLRPKIQLCFEQNYRETRYFQAWTNIKRVEDFTLPKVITNITGQKKTKIGVAIVKLNDTEYAHEICQEMYEPSNPAAELYLDGAEIICNSSGSHHHLRKLNKRLQLITTSTHKSGGVYVYSNQQGCDGSRLYYDGSSMIAMNGQVIKQGSQFSIKNLEGVYAVVNLDDVRNYRREIRNKSLRDPDEPEFPRIEIDYNLCQHDFLDLTEPQGEIRIHKPMEEISLGPALWLWDYLRRSGARGYFLPLSGGLDSASVATIVGSMCHLVFSAIHDDNDEQVLEDLRNITRQDDFTPESPKDVAAQVLNCCYMGTKNSSEETLKRAKALSEDIGFKFYNVEIDDLFDVTKTLFHNLTGKEPKFEAHGGTYNEDLALQNIQARQRMVMSYLMAQLMPWVNEQNGFLLVLGSANLDEGLRGYMTKYDCSSADINPIGGINKSDLRSFIAYAKDHFEYSSLQDILEANPSAELRPIDDKTKDSTQIDEEEMGMTYDELNQFGRLRKIHKCGPVSMFKELLLIWKHLTPEEVATKVKRFFFYYSVNRHKATTLTPAYHAEDYGTDDNRFDHRQFLYNTSWDYQFKRIDKLVKHYTEKKKEV
ncbi:unnamed protein product [Moneuplotes crassus]|uniref:Glutamine-dependent NAD(+) synthetase n=1 Tax=Euplotes crassus TaxID=5936 RepID=A0AAD1U5T3_EUPCR|nr:unnamed protein product [Moneuplotes crassus]